MPGMIPSEDFLNRSARATRHFEKHFLLDPKTAERRTRFEDGGGGVEMIRFEIDAVDTCETCKATANVLSRPIGKDPVTGEDSYDQVAVYDLAGCWLNAPEADLIGLIGHAVRLRGTTPLECEPEPGEEYTGRIGNRWEIISLCCVQNRCEDF